MVLMKSLYVLKCVGTLDRPPEILLSMSLEEGAKGDEVGISRAYLLEKRSGSCAELKTGLSEECGL